MNIDLTHFFEQFEGLEADNIGQWPKVAKITLAIFLAIVVFVLGYFFLISDKITQLDRFVAEEVSLKSQYQAKYHAVANLELFEQQMKEAEEFMKEAQNDAKTFFEKQSKKEKKEISYRFERDEDRLSLSDCEDQLREWAKDLVDREIERRPEGAKLKDLKDLKQKAIDNVMESGTPDELKQSLNLVVKHIGLTWNVDTSKIKAIAQS